MLSNEQPKDELTNISLLYLNSPELTGGKTPFGIDSCWLYTNGL